MGITTQIIGLIVSLSFLVITHEFGHFCFARLFKTRVEKFYLFFNPGISLLRAKKYDGKWHFSFFSSQSPKEFEEHPDNTEWGIGWLPLGGYCSIAGMVDETTKPGELPAEPQSWEFRTKPAWQRLFIILGGVLVNFVSALILYVAILFTWGEDFIPMSNAEYGMYFSEAATEAGFQTGDKIISADGQTFERLGDFTTMVLIDGCQRVKVLRGTDSTEYTDTVTIYLDKEFPQKVIGSERSEQYVCQFNVPFIIDSVLADSPAQKAGLCKGDRLTSLNDSTIIAYYDYFKLLKSQPNKQVKITYLRGSQTDTALVTLNESGMMGVGVALPAQLLEPKHVEYNFFESIPTGIAKGFSTLGDYVKQFKLVFTKEGATQLGGFGTIGSIFPKTWDWQIFWNMTAFLAVILAFMNFLPIPALDGGYILFILVEMITRKKPSDKFIGYANTIGFVLLLALLIYANGLDILRALR